MSAAPKYRTAARRVRGLGAARTGTGHFIGQRVTSVALLFLTIAFIVIVAGLIGRNHAAVVQIIGSPLVSILLTLFVVTTIYHMWIGMQEIIIDYVHEDGPKFAALLANSFFCVLTGTACIFGLMRISFGL
jgi:succinate dehydrogenase / fumarate reductase membrane anchor subunit